MEKKDEEIYLRSEEFEEVLGWVPPWILRWGITLIASIMLILLIGSMLFKYPDIISARMTLTGTVPPAGIMAKNSGKIKELFVQDNQLVTTGDYLAVIENSAETSDILFLKQYLQSLAIHPDSMALLPPKTLQVGTLQSLYSNLYLTLFEYNEFIRLDYFPTKIKMSQERILQYEEQYTSLSRQEKIIKEQLEITRQQFERDSLLSTTGVIAQEEFENTKSQYLQGILSYENILSSLNNMAIQIEQLKETLFENTYQHQERTNTYISQINTQTTQLKTEIESWEISYAIIAPITGEITFTNYWSENQNILAGETVFNIIPTDPQQLKGKAVLPTARSGKVAIGQKVNIRFDNFPDNEFGMVKGKVTNISLVPVQINETAAYIVEIELPEGLLTNYEKELPYLPEMEAQADIITADISAFERMIMPLRQVLKEGFE